MKPLNALLVVALVAALALGGMAVLAYDASPTGYYLPRGYKVSGRIRVPGAGLWPGEYIGGVIGLSTDEYSILVVGLSWKGNIWEGFSTWDGARVVWIQGGREEVKAKADLEPGKEHEVTIVYDYDNTIKISINGKLVYSFIATRDKYTIVAQDASVSAPEALPEPSTTPETGIGYERKSVNELQIQYLLLGAGAAAIAISIIAFLVKGKRKTAKASLAVILVLLIVLGMVGIATYYIYRSSTAVSILPLPLTEEIGDKPVLVALQFGQISPGMVFQVTPDKQGWQIKEKDTRLYEKLELTNIDLSVNDIVAWHGFKWYYSSRGEYLSWSSPFTGTYTEMSHVVGLEDLFLTDTGASWDLVAPSLVEVFVVTGEYRLDFAIKNSTSGSMTWFVGASESSGFTEIAGTVYQNNGVWHVTVAKDGSIVVDEDKTYTTTDYDIVVMPTLTKIPAYPTCIGGKLHYYIVWSTRLTSQELVDVSSRHIVPVKGTMFFIDPTFFNGTHYLDLANDIVGTPNGNVVRIPTEHQWLWLVKGLESDNKVHFKWFPEGTIVRIKDSNGNVVREFSITGSRAGNTTQVLDYAVSLDTTTLVGATIEALVPSMKVRVYAPASSYVAVLSEDGTKYGEYQVGSSGYVDIPLTSPLTNAYIVIYADEESDSGLNIDVKDLGGGKLEVKIYNDKGVLIPGLLVRLVDPANVVLDYAVTDESGTAELDAGRPLAEAKILVDGVWDGTIYRLSKTVSLAETMGGDVESVTTANENKYALLGLFVIILLALVVVLALKRR